MKYKVVTIKNNDVPMYIEGTSEQAEYVFRSLCDKLGTYEDDRFFNFEGEEFIEGWATDNGIEVIHITKE